MIPREASGGRSFKGAFLYYMHDKNALTRERVAWTQTENMITDDPDKAWKVMAYTAMSNERLKEAAGISRTGRKLEYPVFTFSLAWHPEQNPGRDEMTKVARRAIAAIGMEEHEALIIAHMDTPHKHVHVIVNRVHPITGRAAANGYTWNKFSAFALQLEREGGKVYCPQREENYQMRQEGKKTKYRDPVIKSAWGYSATGAEFKNLLEKNGYQLAQGLKRLVVVDPHGKVVNPLRHIGGVKTREFNEKLSDLDRSSLADADLLARAVQDRNKKTYECNQNYAMQMAKAINKMQDRQIEEYAALSSTHYRTISKTEKELSETHQIADTKQEIANLKASIDKCGRFKRALRIDRRMKGRLETLEANLENAQWRLNEKVSHLQNERDQTLEKLKTHQQKERTDLIQLLEKHRPTDQRHRPLAPVVFREVEHVQSRDRKPKGPELGR